MFCSKDNKRIGSLKCKLSCNEDQSLLGLIMLHSLAFSYFTHAEMNPHVAEKVSLAGKDEVV